MSTVMSSAYNIVVPDLTLLTLLTQLPRHGGSGTVESVGISYYVAKTRTHYIPFNNTVLVASFPSSIPPQLTVLTLNWYSVPKFTSTANCFLVNSGRSCIIKCCISVRPFSHESTSTI